jgi:SAM-dependent methyltransferase
VLGRDDQRGLRDFSRAPLRSRFEAAALDHAGDAEPEVVSAWKREVLGGLAGRVVEIGPGPGVNLRHYGPAVERLVAVEPNPAMHDRLRRHAAEAGIALEVRPLHAEVLDLPDGSADAVVGTLVLCGVDDVDAVLAQVRRILRPGGRYAFHEHVVAPGGSRTRLAQRLLKRPHRWLFNGCEVDRDTAARIRSVFPDAEITAADGGWAAAHTRTRILGTATA